MKNLEYIIAINMPKTVNKINMLKYLQITWITKCCY